MHKRESKLTANRIPRILFLNGNIFDCYFNTNTNSYEYYLGNWKSDFLDNKIPLIIVGFDGAWNRPYPVEIVFEDPKHTRITMCVDNSKTCEILDILNTQVYAELSHMREFGKNTYSIWIIFHREKALRVLGSF